MPVKKTRHGCVTLCVTRSLAPAQHISEEKSQRRQALGYTVSDLADPGIEPQTYRTVSLIIKLNGRQVASDKSP